MTTAAATAPKSTGIRIKPGFLWVGVLAATLATAFILRDRVHLEPDSLITYGYIAVFLVPLIGSLTLLLPLPSLPLIFLAGAILNPLATAVVASAGMTVGLIPQYKLGASGSGKLQQALAGKKNRVARLANGLIEKFAGHQALSPFLLAAVPTPVFAFAGVISATAGIRLWKFQLYTLLGRTLFSLGIAMAGFFAADRITALGL